MAYQWLSEQELDARAADLQIAPHPALEPVSAWLFRQHSPFLAAGGLTEAEASLYSMAIDGDGFDASANGAFKAREVPGVQGRAGSGHLFSDAFLGPLLRSIKDDIDDPSVYVLPVPADGVLRDADLGARNGLGAPSDDAMRSPDAAPPRAVIGIIDHGVNIFHQRFRSGRTASRVAFAWLQGAQSQGQLPFGAEWHRGQIEAAQIEAGDDEDALLRQIGADFERPGFRPLAQRTSHGTHVLDLAAGMDPFDPVGARYPIIVVTLPPEVTRETSGSMLALPFVLGLEYILDRARWLTCGHGVPPQVYVNFSFGLSGGPRMGGHQLEKTVHRLAARHVEKTGADRPPVVVVAAGNRNMARGHAQSLPCAKELSVTWHIQPADPTSNFLEMRIVAERGSIDGVDFCLTPPGQLQPLCARLSVPIEDPLEGPQLLGLNTSLIGRVSARQVSGRVTILTLALAPSDPGSTGGTAAPAGDWQVSVQVPGATPDRIDAYVLRDDVPYGFRDGGRQSYFSDPGYVDRDEQGRPVTEDPAGAPSLIRRAGTVNAISTGERHIENTRVLWVVGGYVGLDATGQLRAADYSAAPLDDGVEQIDGSAQSEFSKVLPGVLAAGTRSGSRVLLNGTSVAAPQMVRHLAMGQGTLRPPSDNAQKIRLGQSVLSLRT
ncbi:S8/S53 family peptidase [Sedimentitalea nanhaiensis]|uniref:Subtilase family protein n=1 Tax=Sedimentitalea nanhaiensis TaxID=999627 RepID=A0A1I7E9D0_9RHOB|nr:hypothetical protein [Sedimentitalea nanhaiensis]SFU20548.1 hypothetical protein SAMN05216236_15214 [Sedimentitalea nanhaiensis]